MKIIKYDKRNIKKDLGNAPINTEIKINAKNSHHIIKFERDKYYYIKDNNLVTNRFLTLNEIVGMIKSSEK